MPSTPGIQVFADETKQSSYLLAAAVVRVSDLDLLRRVVRGFVLPRQRRLHMKDESDRRRRAIVSALIEAGVEVALYDAGRRYRSERERRSACLRALVGDLATHSEVTVVLERDDSLVSWDRQRLIEFIRQFACHDSLRYEHRRAAEEQLLAIPDAVAWCWARGGDWRRRIRPLVSHVREV